MAKTSGGFTLPGESGYEALTLALAKKWGADVIRDSDGTALSKEILDAGYQVYSTVCVIREHNAWAKKHPECRQQTILCTPPVVLTGDALVIPLMDSFFQAQFEINDSPEAQSHWQVFDRTSNTLLPRENWTYENGRVTLHGTPFHKYTVSFFAYRVWEEISMYNHTTNNWDKERLMQIDPVHDKAMAYLLDWMENWCVLHPQTGVVRFTSLFYNFVWIWGADQRNRHLFTDWSSYDFTVSPEAFDLFEKRFGYAMELEDFVNKGLRRCGHMPPDQHKKDWMAFIHDLVIEKARPLIDIVHRYGKKAYVFYDDSWVGLEPNSPRFLDFGFDGLIKCVFSGFEVRLCLNAACETHEIRLHPYLFPVGLGGLPTFAAGGDPTRDAKTYWAHVRRALLRQCVDRIGLGGYLHLTEGYPDFQDYMEQLADEFRDIKELHLFGKPMTLKPRVAVLSAFGNLRAWTLSGHFHETDGHDLIHVLESLSGLAFDTRFLSFEDVESGVPKDVDVLIIAGRRGTAWSGGEAFSDRALEAVTRFVHQGGALIGVGEPTAMPGYDTFLRLSPVLGVDIDDGRYACHGQWAFETVPWEGMPRGAELPHRRDVRLLDGQAKVHLEKDGLPLLTSYCFGMGKGIYLSGFAYSHPNTRLLQNLLLLCANEPVSQRYITDDPDTECAWFEASRTLALINLTDETKTASVLTDAGKITQTLPGMGMAVVKVAEQRSKTGFQRDEIPLAGYGAAPHHPPLP